MPKPFWVLDLLHDPDAQKGGAGGKRDNDVVLTKVRRRAS